MLRMFEIQLPSIRIVLVTDFDTTKEPFRLQCGAGRAGPCGRISLHEIIHVNATALTIAVSTDRMLRPFATHVDIC
jgi:hypothetical protein